MHWLFIVPTGLSLGREIRPYGERTHLDFTVMDLAWIRDTPVDVVESIMPHGEDLVSMIANIQITAGGI